MIDAFYSTEHGHLFNGDNIAKLEGREYRERMTENRKDCFDWW